jgi:hypothetical protein
MNAAPGPGSELPKSSDAMPDAVRQQLAEVTRALAQARTALMLIPEQWRPCDDAFILELARVRNQSANERAMTDDEKGIFDPIDYPATLPDKQYKAVRRAVDLIQPVMRNPPRHYGSLWASPISDNYAKDSARDICRMDAEDALRDIGFALFVENFRAFSRTKADKRRARQIAKALRRVDDLVRSFNNPDFPLVGFPFDEVRKWKRVFTEMAMTPSKGTTRLNALKKRLAVAEAYQLLQKYESKRVTATKRGKFCRLATLLYGAEADLINQCKAYIRARTPTAAAYIERYRADPTKRER